MPFKKTENEPQKLGRKPRIRKNSTVVKIIKNKSFKSSRTQLIYFLHKALQFEIS